MTQETATAGRCTCGGNVLRAEAPDGTIVTTDVWPVDAAAELRAWMVGRPSYSLSLRSGVMLLQPRTTRDIKMKPVGYRADHVVLTHQCRPTP